MKDNEREYWVNITRQCEDKYLYLIDKLALKYSHENVKKNISEL